MTETPRELVQRFLTDWHTLDVERVMGYFADDAVYHNIPMEPLVGKDAIAAFFNSWIPDIEGLEAEVHHVLAEGPLVATERTDTIVYPGKPVRLRVFGIFEIEDGKIAHWREYFDLGEMRSQLGPASGSSA